MYYLEGFRELSDQQLVEKQFFLHTEVLFNNLVNSGSGIIHLHRIFLFEIQILMILLYF